jgi:hypothetical protein
MQCIPFLGRRTTNQKKVVVNRWEKAINFFSLAFAIVIVIVSAFLGQQQAAVFFLLGLGTVCFLVDKLLSLT